MKDWLKHYNRMRKLDIALTGLSLSIGGVFLSSLLSGKATLIGYIVIGGGYIGALASSIIYGKRYSQNNSKYEQLKNQEDFFDERVPCLEERINPDIIIKEV